MKLPIENITREEFNDFRSKYLNGGKLSEEALKEIGKLFSSGDPSVGRVHCDESHAHGYECVQYTNFTTGIVDRLINEIRDYQARFKEIKEVLDKYSFKPEQ